MVDERSSSAAAAADAATRAHFTARAAAYAGAGDASLRAILDLAAPRPGERVLDVATGTGLVLFALAGAIAAAPARAAHGARAGGVHHADGGRRPAAGGEGDGPAAGRRGLAVGADFTPAMLARAAQRAAEAPSGGPAALVAAHAAYLPFGPARFDAVTCRFSLHHMADAEAAVAAMAAALRPGGRLVIADFVRPEDPAEGARHDRLEQLRGHQHVRIYERSRLEAMLAAAGCPVVDSRVTRRESTAQDWLDNPNVAAEARAPLAALLEEIGRSEAGGAGLEVRRVDGEVRFVRADVVLLGVKRG